MNEVEILFFIQQTTSSCQKSLVLHGRRGRDRMVVGFTTTSPISAYHHLSCEFKLHVCS